MKLYTLILAFLLILSACRRDDPEMMDKMVRHTLTSAKVNVLGTPKPHDAKLVELGKNLMFDRILSGRKDISCATCHYPSLYTDDGISLSIGVGGKGLGTARVPGKGRIFTTRNAPDLFNKSMPEFTALNWDGSVSLEKDKLETPAGKDLPPGLDGPLAAQHLFELASRLKMRGEAYDSVAIDNTPNELASIPDDNYKAIWKAYMTRLIGDPPGEGGIRKYIELFKAAYPTVDLNEIGIQHAVNAIAAWEADTWTFANSPFDRYLAGDSDALNTAQKRGTLVFYGKARCYECHSGNLLTDMKYHNIGAPQIGPGVPAVAPLDPGRGGITNKPEDKFKFRTAPLRNVALTGPWTHSGAYTTLEATVRHHLSPKESLRNYDPSMLDPRYQEMVHDKEIIAAGVLSTVDGVIASPINLSDQEFSDLMEFLQSLTDPKALDQLSEIPENVPSGLPLRD